MGVGDSAAGDGELCGGQGKGFRSWGVAEARTARRAMQDVQEPGDRQGERVRVTCSSGVSCTVNGIMGQQEIRPGGLKVGEGNPEGRQVCRPGLLHTSPWMEPRGGEGVLLVSGHPGPSRSLGGAVD